MTRKEERENERNIAGNIERKEERRYSVLMNPIKSSEPLLHYYIHC